MKTNIETIREIIRNDDAGKFDIEVASSDIYFNPDGTFLVNKENREFELTGWAISQLCNKLAIPSEYLQRCSKPLQQQNILHWLNAYNSKKIRTWLLRCKENKIRAILSDRYSVVNNSDVLTMVESFGITDDIEFNLTNNMIRFSFLNKEKIPVDGGYRIGVSIINSEVGIHRIEILPVSNRLACDNYVIYFDKAEIPYLLHKHLGVDLVEVAMIGRQVINFVANKQGYFENRIRKTMEVEVENIEKFSKRYQLPAKLTKDVVENIGERNNLWAVINEYTKLVQGYSPEVQYYVQRRLGEV